MTAAFDESSAPHPAPPAPPLASVEWDAEGRVVDWSPEAERLFGWRAEEVRGRRSSEWGFVHADDLGRVAQVAAAFASGGARQSFSSNRNLTRDGRVLHCEWYNAALQRPDGSLAAQFSLVLDVSARVEAEERARQALERAEAARAAAEEASRTKSSFLATMSHEIRTPINAVVGYVDLLEMGMQGELNPGQRGYLDRIRASSRHLLGLVNDVLDFARLEAGEVPFAREPVGVREAITDAAAMVLPLASARGIALLEEPCSADAAVLGDADRIRQVLINLLSNAVKFTRPGGRVSVRCVPSPPPAGGGAGPWEGWTALEVEDTGIGIAPEHLERVFDPFTQVDESHTREVGGTGLGLAISRRFARLMDGELAARSEPGTGSVFTLRLSTAAAPLPTAREPQPEARVPAEGRAAFLHAGRALEDAADDLVAAWARRVADDPEVPSARVLGRAQVEDHTTTFVTELGRTLTVLGSSPSDAERGDSASIQRTIAALHGAQRARLGFGVAEVGREYLLLWGELQSFLRARGAGVQVLDAIRRMVDRAVRVGVENHAAVPRSDRLLGRTQPMAEHTAHTVRRLREDAEEAGDG